jgi:hypothetical protein
MLAAKPHRHNRSEATDDETLGVDHDPLFVDFGGLSRKRAHLYIHEWNCAGQGRRVARLSIRTRLLGQQR